MFGLISKIDTLSSSFISRRLKITALDMNNILRKQYLKAGADCETTRIKFTWKTLGGKSPETNARILRMLDLKWGFHVYRITSTLGFFHANAIFFSRSVAYGFLRYEKDHEQLTVSMKWLQRAMRNSAELLGSGWHSIDGFLVYSPLPLPRYRSNPSLIP